MAFEFLFADGDETKWEMLQQGDVLKRTTELADCLREAHSYYADAHDYTHFMVLTQSCDLVLRDGKSRPNARYITIAAIRSLSILTDRLLDRYKFSNPEFPLSICDKVHEPLARNQLERLIHNTEDSYFLIPKDSHPHITTDKCAFLRLSVALRADHYKTLVKAKIAQLDNVFQAKVGWLTGNMYSRVGTPDIEEFEEHPDAIKEELLSDALYRSAAWLTSYQFRELKSKTKAWKRDNPEVDLAPEEALRMVKEIPSEIDILARRVAEQLKQKKLLSGDPDSEERVANVLRNDRVIRKILGTD